MHVASWGREGKGSGLPACVESTLVSCCRVAKTSMVSVRLGRASGRDVFPGAPDFDRMLVSGKAYMAAPCARSCQLFAASHGFLLELLRILPELDCCVIGLRLCALY